MPRYFYICVSNVLPLALLLTQPPMGQNIRLTQQVRAGVGSGAAKRRQLGYRCPGALFIRIVHVQQ